MIVPNDNLYKWQIDYIEHIGNTTMKGGRQIGKSMIAAKRIIHLANEYPGCIILILAASERQENYLLDKVKLELGKYYNYLERPTQTRLVLPNETKIYKFPVGRTGVYVEGLSNVDFIFIDEAIHFAERVYDSVIPMVAEPRKRGLGWINLLSATRGKAKGLFKDSFDDKKFYKVSQKAEDQPHIDKKFLAEELERLGEEMYGVIYNGDFSERGHKYFPKEHVLRAAKIGSWNHKREYNRALKYFLGIDPAGKGRSEAAFVTAELRHLRLGKKSKQKLRLVHYEVQKKSDIFDMLYMTRRLNSYFNYLKMYIDPRGIGRGFTDILEKDFRRKVRALDNSESGKFNKVLKEDLYSNLLRLLAMKDIEILNDEKLIKGLLDVEWDDSRERIIGTDISEAATRACWGIIEKPLKVRAITF